MTTVAPDRPARAGTTPLALAVAAALLATGLIASIALGAASIPLAQVPQLLLQPDDSTESLIVWTIRVPRALIASFAGAALAVSGAILQGVTRNPLADPGILGVEAGAEATTT